MLRRSLAVALVLALGSAVVPAITSARSVKPVIKGVEVGYFGSAVVTHQVSVFVYSNLGPRAGTHVTVCLRGVCKRAHGHNARTAWYSASFHTSGLRMGDRVTFTATAADSAGQTKVTATKNLLCMHNNGSTPQH